MLHRDLKGIGEKRRTHGGSSNHETDGRGLNGVSRAQIPADAYLLIIGAMKCSTSSLFNYLAPHPSICPCITKEPEFFLNTSGTAARV